LHILPEPSIHLGTFPNEFFECAFNESRKDVLRHTLWLYHYYCVSRQVT